MREVVADANLVAYCGLYCGACRRYLREGCPGCRENEKAAWCKARTCCIEQGYAGCADCQEVTDVADCKKLNNLIARIFSFIFRSDRRACILAIKERGREAYAAEMAAKKMMAIKR